MPFTPSLVRPRRSHRNPLARYVPKALTAKARWRFTRSRRDEYLRRVSGEPDDRQSLIIMQLIEAEWSAITCERKAIDAGASDAAKLLRSAAEFRRQLILLDRDLELTTRKPRPVNVKPGVPQLDLEQHMGKLSLRREGAS